MDCLIHLDLGLLWTKTATLSMPCRRGGEIFLDWEVRGKSEVTVNGREGEPHGNQAILDDGTAEERKLYGLLRSLGFGRKVSGVGLDCRMVLGRTEGCGGVAMHSIRKNGGRITER
ncbi:unnamed protein product, partial [Ectocarpus sp. 12 AP-2014]